VLISSKHLSEEDSGRWDDYDDVNAGTAGNYSSRITATKTSSDTAASLNAKRQARPPARSNGLQKRRTRTTSAARKMCDGYSSGVSEIRGTGKEGK